MKEKELTGKQIEEVSDTSEKGGKMENNALDINNLEAVTGGQDFSANWDIGDQVSILSAKPQCPDCRGLLFDFGTFPERGYDIFRCKCGRYYAHFYAGDSWNRAYLA